MAGPTLSAQRLVAVALTETVDTLLYDGKNPMPDIRKANGYVYNYHKVYNAITTSLQSSGIDSLPSRNIIITRSDLEDVDSVVLGTGFDPVCPEAVEPLIEVMLRNGHRAGKWETLEHYHFVSIDASPKPDYHTLKLKLIVIPKTSDTSEYPVSIDEMPTSCESSYDDSDARHLLDPRIKKEEERARQGSDDSGICLDYEPEFPAYPSFSFPGSAASAYFAGRFKKRLMVPTEVMGVQNFRGGVLFEISEEHSWKQSSHAKSDTVRQKPMLMDEWLHKCLVSVKKDGPSTKAWGITCAMKHGDTDLTSYHFCHRHAVRGQRSRDQEAKLATTILTQFAVKVKDRQQPEKCGIRDLRPLAMSEPGSFFAYEKDLNLILNSNNRVRLLCINEKCNKEHEEIVDESDHVIGTTWAFTTAFFKLNVTNGIDGLLSERGQAAFRRLKADPIKLTNSDPLYTKYDHLERYARQFEIKGFQCLVPRINVKELSFEEERAVRQLIDRAPPLRQRQGQVPRAVEAGVICIFGHRFDVGVMHFMVITTKGKPAWEPCAEVASKYPSHLAAYAATRVHSLSEEKKRYWLDVARWVDHFPTSGKAED
ncbi:hypothetical protein LTR17_007172 [Elasticomyces elasticus]|nr:hypothetical protein LTR17_007172 [Elasticomyces elasticus]